MANLRTEIWQTVIENNFFASWERLKAMATEDNSYVSKPNGQKHFKAYIPQAGMLRKPLINPTQYPLTVDVREDDVLDYQLDNLVMEPEYLNDYDVSLISYDKLSSILEDMVGNLGEEYLYRAMARWYPGKVTNQHVETSGSATGATAPGATGNRKSITIADFRKATELLEAQSAPGERMSILPNSMFWQLVAEIETKNWNVRLVEKDGLSMLEAPIYNTRIAYFPKAIRTVANGSAAKFPQDAGAATDQEVGLVYVKRAVSIARPEQDGVNYYFNEKDATYQGDIVSANTWMGASYRRLDKKGIIPIIQANAT